MQLCGSLSILWHFLSLGLEWIEENKKTARQHQELIQGCAKSFQSCPTFCDPMDSNLPGSYIQGNFLARILEWDAVPSSRGSSRPRDGTHLSLCPSHWQAGSLPLAPGKPSFKLVFRYSKWDQFAWWQFSSHAWLCDCSCPTGKENYTWTGVLLSKYCKSWNILKGTIIMIDHGSHLYQVRREDTRDVGTAERCQWT